MEHKITITINDEGFALESDLDEADLLVMLDHVKLDILLKMRDGS